MKQHDSLFPKVAQMPDFSREKELMAQGYKSIAGIDEAGRGPLAGPVVVASVILDPDHIPAGLNDSKKISEKRRDKLFALIIETAQVAIVSAPPAIIARLNIRGATLWAMKEAVLALPCQADYALFDGRDVPLNLFCEAEAMVKGDSRSSSIAAASIVAKVTRDNMCQTMHKAAPEFGFSSHKGYGTARHLGALSSFGPTPHHRADFGPVAAALSRLAHSS
ncbi:MAG: ribonuclease HII [Devosiaceae bacterium]|nr:ribonuclease HII [Devosiaceae bacterium]